MEYRTLIFLFFCIAANASETRHKDVADSDSNRDAQFSFEANDKISEESIEAPLLPSTPTKKSQWSSRGAILFIADKHIDFLVYERNDMDNPHLLKFDCADNSKYINKEWKTVMFIHGWRSKDNFVDSLKNAFAALDGQNINLIGVNWKKGSSNPTYFPSAKRVSSVGKTVAKFIVNNRKHIDLDKLIIIGHSLGAHAAGYAGKFLKKNYELTAPEIIGLDPAGLGFQGKKEKLNPDDAKNVIVFHSSKSLGHFEPLGTVDIYINGGVQPGLTHSQSHKFSKKFYKDIIDGTEEMIGYRYSSFDDVKAGKIPIEDENNEIKLFHGEDLPPRGTLIYVGTQDQTQLRSDIENKKTKKHSVKRITSFKRFFSIKEST